MMCGMDPYHWNMTCEEAQGLAQAKKAPENAMARARGSQEPKESKEPKKAYRHQLQVQ